MNIEQLNEKITWLADLVASANDTIKNAEEIIKLAEQERDRLADQRRESEPKFERVKKNENYYYLEFGSALGSTTIYSDADTGHNIDKNRFDNNNYFHTKERAQEVADKINLLLKLERLHDVFCPDFNLGLRDGLDVEKYYVYYNFVHEQWMSSCMIHASSVVQVYFSTKEIARKVCDILNAELKEENERDCNE